MMIRSFFPQKGGQWLGPVLLLGAVVLFVGIAVITSGLIDLSAAKPHPEGWARFLHYTFERSTAAHADTAPPVDLDTPVRVAAGAAYYGQVCARCHSGPGLGQNPVVLSMHPRPQYLATDLADPGNSFSAPELFRIVKAGVKYSAMPSWPADGRDDEIWNMVAFLRVLPRLSPERFRAMALTQPASMSRQNAGIAFGPLVPGKPNALRSRGEPPVTSFSYRSPAYGFVGFGLREDVLPTCARCHGAQGTGGGAFPNLTLQTPTYLARTLTAFATGRRRSGYMQVIASELSPQQIKAVAQHYAALPRRASASPTGAVSAFGQRLALRGDRALGIGACAGCHGIDRAAAKAYPPLEGQSRWYIANQMRVFRAGGRGGVYGDNPMPAIARKLDDRAIDAIASYYAAQPPAIVQGHPAPVTQ